MTNFETLKTKIFADGANPQKIIDLAKVSYIKGFTTNPSLMAQAKIRDYEDFAKNLTKQISNKPISFEIFADDFEGMENQALKIASWGDNIYVKIPVMNTKGEKTYKLIKRLSDQGVKLNITAIMTYEQIYYVTDNLSSRTPAIISVFAGRIADTGKSPLTIMSAALELLSLKPQIELLWASCREIWNIFQAEQIGCDIITVPNSLLEKSNLLGYDLEKYSLDTVKGFYSDAEKAGYKL